MAPDLRRSRYDVAAATAAIAATGYAVADGLTEAIAGVVTREEAMDAFEPQR